MRRIASAVLQTPVSPAVATPAANSLPQRTPGDRHGQELADPAADGVVCCDVRFAPEQRASAPVGTGQGDSTDGPARLPGSELTSNTVREMPSRRSTITMTEDEVAAFLEEQKILNVATIGPSGHPHVVAMWFVVLDGKPAFWTFGKSQKVTNIRRDPKITGLVESGESYNELRGVELVGTARLLEDYDTILDLGMRVATKYTGAPGEAGLPFVEKQAAKRVGIVIDVDHVVSWDHTKLGGAY